MKAITSADVVLAFPQSGQTNSHVYFELGIALGRGIPLLIVAPTDLEVPIELREIPTIRTDIDNEKAIGFALDQILQLPPPLAGEPPVAASSARPIGEFADALLRRLEKLESHGRGRIPERAYVGIVADAVSASVTPVIVDENIRFAGAVIRPDIAVWSDELDPWVGNPLLIEVKGSMGRKSIRAALRQLLNYLLLSNTRGGLLVYADGPAEAAAEETIPDSHAVYVIALRDLLAALRHNSFPDVMRQLRNEQVHGMHSR